VLTERGVHCPAERSIWTTSNDILQSRTNDSFTPLWLVNAGGDLLRDFKQAMSKNSSSSKISSVRHHLVWGVDLKHSLARVCDRAES
jgi:hypothetical protein